MTIRAARPQARCRDPRYWVGFAAGLGLVVVWAVVVNHYSFEFPQRPLAQAFSLGYSSLVFFGLMPPGAPWRRDYLRRRRSPPRPLLIELSGDAPRLDGQGAPYSGLVAFGLTATLSILAVAASMALDVVRGSAPANASGAALSLSGHWEIVDTATTGQPYTFTVTMKQTGSSISATGKGLSVSGWSDGNSAVAGFSNGAQHGQFTWTAQPDGTLSGTFRTDDGSAAGSSVARKLP